MNFEVYDIAIVPVIVALVSVMGQIGLPDRFKPVVALLLGVAGGFGYVSPDDWRQAAFVGVVMGLSAIGAYSGVKNMVERRG